MRVLLTGGGGFLGAWIMRRLLRAGDAVRVFDAHGERRLALAFAGEDARAIEWLVGDIADTEAVAVAAAGCDAIIHVAAVLTPSCREDPVAGARINVIGTLNVFEAARRHGVRQVIYTSSGGVFGPDHARVPHPTTHYGAFKLANEGSARAYWEDVGIASIGFRPFVIYGPGRETGLTAGPTLACRAAALREPYAIPFSGAAGLVWVDDVAAAYEAAVRSTIEGAHTINLPGRVATMDQVVEAIRRLVPGADLRVAGPPLPSAADAPDEWSSDLLDLGDATPLEVGLEQTIRHYRSGL